MVTRKARVGLLALTLIGALVALGPAGASAACVGPDGSVVDSVVGSVSGILNETMESPPPQAGPGGPLLAGAFPDGQDVRIAQASERGVFGNGCGTLAGLIGDVTVQAQSRIPFYGIDPNTGYPVFGSGPITGSFSVNGAAGVVNGKLDGFLYFKPGNPVVPAGGAWSTNGKGGTSGLFGGVALVPFQLSPDPSAPWYYVDAGLSRLGYVVEPNAPFPAVLLQPTDYNAQFGNPEAKFIITLYQQ